jgi:hypothetical protein
MGKTVNILGDTAKEQWLNAINIYETCIYENVRSVRETLDGLCNWDIEGVCDECGYCNSLDIAMRNTRNFADEMRRLVEGVM